MKEKKWLKCQWSIRQLICFWMNKKRRRVLHWNLESFIVFVRLVMDPRKRKLVSNSIVAVVVILGCLFHQWWWINKKNKRDIPIWKTNRPFTTHTNTHGQINRFEYKKKFITIIMRKKWTNQRACVQMSRYHYHDQSAVK